MMAGIHVDVQLDKVCIFLKEAWLYNKRRFTPVCEGGSGRRPLPPQTLGILVGFNLKLLSLYCIFGLDLKWLDGVCFINELVAWKVCFVIGVRKMVLM